MLDRILDRTVSVTMVLLVFVVLGAVSIGRLPVSLIPDVDIPFVTVQVSAPDLSAREMDDVVVRPLRQSLVQINHLDDLSATSRDGSATITLTLEEGQDVDFFFINSDFVADKLGDWAKNIFDITATFKLNGKDFEVHPAYLVAFYLVYVGLSVLMWYVYELLFKGVDSLELLLDKAEQSRISTNEWKAMQRSEKMETYGMRINHLEVIANGLNEMFSTRPLSEWHKALGDDIIRVLHPDFFAAPTYNGNADVLAIIQALRDNSLLNASVKPQAPIHLYHVPTDEQVPYVNATTALEAWPGSTLTNLEMPTHAVGGAEFFLRYMGLWEFIGPLIK